MEKLEYISPEMEIIEFESEDIITASGDPVETDANGTPIYTG